MNFEGPRPKASSDLTGRTVGDYCVLRRLGRGGMADVYLARQESLRRNVALKVLKVDLARDESYIARFQREAQSAASLVQANIVQVYEVGQLEGLHYIAQEYVVGRNLREYIARFGAVKPVMAVNVLRQVALALKKADEHGVTHRDIKPENIMLTPSGEVKVADFGLARINDDASKDLTQIGITMGTPLYMSPEQVEGQLVDVRSDIYSLGVTAYHMLAGKPPFDGETALAIAVQHVKNDPESLSVIRPDVPSEMVQLIDKMMAKSATDRPQNASELLKSIKKIKIDVDSDWDQLVETLAIENAITKPTIALPESRLAVTRQLQSVMKGNIRSWWTNLTTVLTFLLLGAIGVFAGVWTSNQIPAKNPLAESSPDESGVVRKSTAKEQYEYAIHWFSRDPQYFQAVIDYFPVSDSDELQNQTRLYVDRARERLGEISILNGEYEKAFQIYSMFSQSDYENRLYAVGHAGLAIVFHEQGKHEQAKEKILLIEPEIDKKDDRKLNAFLSRRLKSIRNHYFNNDTVEKVDDRGNVRSENSG